MNFFFSMPILEAISLGRRKEYGSGTTLFIELTEVNNESRIEVSLQLMDQFIHSFMTRKNKVVLELGLKIVHLRVISVA